MFDSPSPKKTEVWSNDTALEIYNTSEVVSRPKGIITNAIWNSSYVVWTMLISFVLTPVMIQYLGITDYGILLLVWSVTGIMGTLNLGLGEATLRYVARYHGEHNMEGVNRVFGITLSVFLILCVIISTPLFTASPLIVQWINIPLDQHQLVSSLFRLSVLTISVSTIMSLFGAIILALQRYDINIRINMIGSVFRTVGYIALVISGFGILYLVIWDLLVTLGIFFFTIRAARRLLPQLIIFPSFSFLGLREVLGYSTFSFLTFLFHKWHRESGKLLMARFFGPAPVVYLTAPDNIAQRFHDVVASGIEATLPRFSAEKNANATEVLFWNTTWAGFAFSLVLLVPFFVLIPDFLSLWINPDFAAKSALIGQLLALYLVFQGGFTAPAAYFRGIGKPWFVTVVIFFSLLITVLASLILIPAYGPTGAAYAYLAGSGAPFFGTIFGAIYAFRWSSVPKFFRAIILPLISGGLAGATGFFIRSHFGDLSWVGLVAHGFLLVVISVVLVFGTTWVSGGSNNPSKQIFGRLIQSKFGAVFYRRG